MAIKGAIIGDIIGSRFEFNRAERDTWKTCDLFSEENDFTDDTVLTCATQYALDNRLPFGETYHFFGNKYPNRGYGYRFWVWLISDDPEPYYSYGNGSAMRITPIIDNAVTEFMCLDEAERSAKCTHNHPEGIKGAQTTAMCGFMAKDGASKKDIEDYILHKYPPDKYKWTAANTMAELRDSYEWDETCQGSVPIAIKCFLDSEDYESFIRNVLSLNGDADTLCAIGGGIAEEFYGKSLDNADEILKRYLPSELREVVIGKSHNLFPWVINKKTQ